jgi:hypothetical protein
MVIKPFAAIACAPHNRRPAIVAANLLVAKYSDKAPALKDELARDVLVVEAHEQVRATRRHRIIRRPIRIRQSY